MPKILINPMIVLLMQLIVLVIGVFGLLSILSLAEVDIPNQESGMCFKKSINSSVSCTFNKNLKVYGVQRGFEVTDEVLTCLAVFAFGMFWLLEFAAALGKFMSSYSVVLWYFTTPDPEDGVRDVPCPLWEGFVTGLSFHSGSLALGSFFVTLFRLIKWLLDYMKKKADQRRQEAEAGSGLSAAFTAGAAGLGSRSAESLAGCAGCMEKVMSLISNLAYIEMAINSTPLCESSWNAFKRLFSAGPAVLLLKGVTGIIQGVGVFIIGSVCTLTTACFVYFIPAFSDKNSGWYIEAPAVVNVCVLVVCMLASYGVMDVLGQTADTLLLCFLFEQEDIKTASRYGVKQQIHAPERLRQIIEEENGVELTAKGKYGQVSQKSTARR